MTQRKSRPVVLFSVILLLHLLALGATAFIIVFVPQLQKKPQIRAYPTRGLQPQLLDKRVNLAELEAAMPSRLPLERLSAESALSTMPLPEAAAPDIVYTALVADFASSLHGFSLAELTDQLDMTLADVPTLGFLGMEFQAERVVVAFDISASVANKAEQSGIPITRIKDETERLVSSFSPNMLFGLVQFSRNYDWFEQYLVPGASSHKTNALHWLRTEFRTDGRSGSSWQREDPNGIESVLKAVLERQPEVLILISDASFQRNTSSAPRGEDVPWPALAAVLDAYEQQGYILPRIQFFGFQVKPEDAGNMRSIVNRTGGVYREL